VLKARNTDGEVYLRFNYGMLQVPDAPVYTVTMTFQVVQAAKNDIGD